MSGGGGYAAPDFFLLFSFPCSVDHERDWPPCKVVFFRVGNQYAQCEKQQQQQQQPSGNPFKCHKEVLSLHPMILPERFDISPPDWGMLRRSRCVQIFLETPSVRGKRETYSPYKEKTII